MNLNRILNDSATPNSPSRVMDINFILNESESTRRCLRCNRPFEYTRYSTCDSCRVSY